ncbi:SOS response-associated peptidase family protein [Pulveribacter sp.]|uniref:SOS response-associated peptidase n=1 Tax=Pulveribacter sp. TaxID=2678893 RepID=UPI0028AEB47E|nr:SOS response-associated peptidase family protein [Pulveribacter sp.]
MCNRYTPPELVEIEREWHIGRQNPVRWWDEVLFPHGQGPFIRRARHETEYSRELAVGQWGLIPWFAKEPNLKYPTNNARSEELSEKASYKLPWARGQRCIIPASSFDEPNWETGKNVWWRFRRTDGRPWGLAGLWSSWVDKVTGEEHESYTMLTINADDHPLMRRMHKPNPKKPAGRQDKRSVISIEPEDVDTWLAGTMEQAKGLLRLPAMEVFDAGPAEA